jgi:hypothetical protein
MRTSGFLSQILSCFCDRVSGSIYIIQSSDAQLESRKAGWYNTSAQGKSTGRSKICKYFGSSNNFAVLINVATAFFHRLTFTSIEF